MDTLKAFKDIEEKVFVDPTGKIHGLDYVANLLALSVGSGSQVLRSDQSGIWLGAARYANAPLRVNMAGSLFASSAEISGKITATSGSIGGFTIMADYLYAGAGGNTCGLSPTDYPFWAGATYANRASAPFRVTPAGAIMATSGSIGGFTIMADYLYAGAGGNTCGLSPTDYPFWAGATYANRATAPFRVDMQGNVVASSATFSQYATTIAALLKAEAGQTLSGDIQVGVGNIRIDGVNRRILINDGFFDRILIGYQLGGF
jgi:hypothetical protein